MSSRLMNTLALLHRNSQQLNYLGNGGNGRVKCAKIFHAERENNENESIPKENVLIYLPYWLTDDDHPLRLKIEFYIHFILFAILLWGCVFSLIIYE